MIFSGIVLRMIPGIMMGYYSIVSTKMSDLVESLRKMKLPDFIIIPVLIMFRFLYSIKEDYIFINEAMKMHGLTMRNFLKEPIRVLEYKTVPLLMCSTKTADDVAISAMTRGMEVGAQRTSVSEVKLGIADYLMYIFIGGIVFIFLSSIYA